MILLLSFSSYRWWSWASELLHPTSWSSYIVPTMLSQVWRPAFSLSFSSLLCFLVSCHPHTCTFLPQCSFPGLPWLWRKTISINRLPDLANKMTRCQLNLPFKWITNTFLYKNSNITWDILILKCMCCLREIGFNVILVIYLATLILEEVPRHLGLALSTSSQTSLSQ